MVPALRGHLVTGWRDAGGVISADRHQGSWRGYPRTGLSVVRRRRRPKVSACHLFIGGKVPPLRMRRRQSRVHREKRRLYWTAAALL
jgi:hypothetical protein